MKTILFVAAAALAACSSTNHETRTAQGTSPATWGAGATTAPNSAAQVPPTAAGDQHTPMTSTTDNNTGVQIISGRLARVSPDSLRLDSATGSSMTLKIDSTTPVFRNGSPYGVTALHEGDQVRAAFDQSQNKVMRIEVLDASGMSQGVDGTAPRTQPKAPDTDATTAPQR